MLTACSAIHATFDCHGSWVRQGAAVHASNHLPKLSLGVPGLHSNAMGDQRTGESSACGAWAEGGRVGDSWACKPRHFCPPEHELAQRTRNGRVTLVAFTASAAAAAVRAWLMRTLDSKHQVTSRCQGAQHRVLDSILQCGSPGNVGAAAGGCAGCCPCC